MGLAISSKETKPIDFGTVEVGSGKIVRSSLMVNDSADPITIYAIDVIEPENGLQMLKQGCAVDMELQPGSSCPITLLWSPEDSTPISTDLIVRHSGKLGFAVIPIRGASKGASARAESGGTGSVSKKAATLPKNAIVLPPSADDLEKEVRNRFQPISGVLLGPDAAGMSSMPVPEEPKKSEGKLCLIGTIGTSRALFLSPGGDTVVVQIGDSVMTADGLAKLVSVNSTAATIVIDGNRRTLPLEASSWLVSSAMEKQSKKEGTPQPGETGRSGGSKK